jgi:hydrogenase expression/formation protein HypC
MCLAIPGRIVTITDDGELTRRGRVDFSGIVREVNLAFVPEAAVGDYVIVHVGVALSVVDQREAERVFEYLREIDEVRELEADP